MDELNAMLLEWSPMIWLLAAVIFAVVEAATVQLMSVWFAVGAVAAMIAALFGGSFWVQFGVFLAVSVLVLALTRPIVKKVLKVKQVHTNADQVVGRIATVTRAIGPAGEVGRVVVDGQDWAAVTQDGFPIDEGEKVLVKSIEGVKLIVESV